MKTFTNNKMLKRMLLVLLVCSLIAGTLTACGSKKKTGGITTFTVGFDAEFPPYGYKDDNGEYVGFDLSLAEEVCKRNGWELVKQPIDWDSKDMELASGTIDCIWNGFTMNGRESDYTWTTPYIDNSQVVIVKSGSAISQLSDLAGKVVVVQADSSALAAFTGDDATEENLALAKSFASLQQVGDYNAAFMNLESGSVDAICMDMGVAKYELEARGSQFRMLSEQVSKEQYGMAHPEGYRKALRLAHEAEKFHRPVINFVDTGGAFCGVGAEERGQGEAIARCLYEFIELKTPVISVVTGEGGSGGALALAVADRVLMLENALYSVISPRGCASILWKDPSREAEAADTLHITAQDLYSFGMIEGIIQEGSSNAQLMRNVARTLRDQLAEVTAEPSIETMLQKRYEKFRKVGVFRTINQDQNEGV